MRFPSHSVHPPLPYLKEGGLTVPVGVKGFDLSSASRRPSFPVSPSLCRPARFTEARRCHLCLSTESTTTLRRTSRRRRRTHTHTHAEPLATHSLTPPPQVLLLATHPLPSTSPSISLRKGAVLSGSLKPCLYCQRTCRHLPPLEHLVPSCWAWTENSTIRSPMNCCFQARDKHAAL